MALAEHGRAATLLVSAFSMVSRIARSLTM